jgi:hypothetical protein
VGSGTPVVDVRVGAYLILLFVFVAGITEMPNGCIARELEEIKTRSRGSVAVLSTDTHKCN